VARGNTASTISQSLFVIHALAAFERRATDKGWGVLFAGENKILRKGRQMGMNFDIRMNRGSRRGFILCISVIQRWFQIFLPFFVT
jgi:hypothetical protein